MLSMLEYENVSIQNSRKSSGSQFVADKNLEQPEMLIMTYNKGKLQNR
jgi:hypothetical protein